VTLDEFIAYMNLRVKLFKSKEEILMAEGYKKPKRKAVDWRKWSEDEQEAIDGWMIGNGFLTYKADGFNITIEEKPIYAYKIVKRLDGFEIVERTQIGTEKRLTVHKGG
jgi:hypothetical protein